MYTMRHEPYTERGIRLTECFSPILMANRPNLRCDSGKSHEKKKKKKKKNPHKSYRMPWLSNGDSFYWSPLLIPYGRSLQTSDPTVLSSFLVPSFQSEQVERSNQENPRELFGYILYMGTVVLTGKKTFFFFFFCTCIYVDIVKEDKLFPFCTLCLSRNICNPHLPEHAQLSSRSGLNNMGPKRALSVF